MISVSVLLSETNFSSSLITSSQRAHSKFAGASGLATLEDLHRVIWVQIVAGGSLLTKSCRISGPYMAIRSSQADCTLVGKYEHTFSKASMISVSVLLLDTSCSNSAMTHSQTAHSKVAGASGISTSDDLQRSNLAQMAAGSSLFTNSWTIWGPYIATSCWQTPVKELGK